MAQESSRAATKTEGAVGGLAGWLLQRLSAVRRSPARLTVLERIALAPRQSLALVEAEGRRFLVAISPEGTPAFFALDPTLDRAVRRADGVRTGGLPAKTSSSARTSRISW